MITLEFKGNIFSNHKQTIFGMFVVTLRFASKTTHIKTNSKIAFYDVLQELIP